MRDLLREKVAMYDFVFPDPEDNRTATQGLSDMSAFEDWWDGGDPETDSLGKEIARIGWLAGLAHAEKICRANSYAFDDDDGMGSIACDSCAEAIASERETTSPPPSVRNGKRA